MKLSEYIDSHPRAERRAVRERIAKASGRTEAAVKHWANGIRQCPPTVCAVVVKACEGKVSLHELRPGVFDESAEVAA